MTSPTDSLPEQPPGNGAEPPRPGVKLNRRKFAFIVLTLAVAGGLALLIMELGVRVALGHYHPNRQITFRFAPDGTPLGPAERTVIQRTPKGDYNLEIEFNRAGLRDSKLIDEARTGDWIALGDSFTFGWGVTTEQRFGDVMAAELGEHVFNLAIPTDFRGYAKLLAHAESRGARIGRLVIGVCMENDLLDYRIPPRDPLASVGPVRRLRLWLKENSALYLCVSTELQRQPALRRLLEAVGVARPVDHPDLFNRNRLDDDALQSGIDAL